MPNRNVLALDVGDKRIGLALARADVRVPIALATLERNNEDFWQQLVQAATDNNIQQIVIGLPRGLDGQDTAQTLAARAFAEELSAHLDLPQSWQDEALTSVRAEAALNTSNKPYAKSDVDSLAATFILSDYLDTEKGTS